MSTDNAMNLPVQDDPAGVKLFTIETANQALVLVRRVVEDTVASYRDLMQLRTEHDELQRENGDPAAIEDLQRRVGEKVNHLNGLEAELRDIGCQLKDWSGGLVDFPAKLEGRLILLCWKLGEDEVRHWHEWDAGFAGRRPVDERFAQAE